MNLKLFQILLCLNVACFHDGEYKCEVATLKIDIKYTFNIERLVIVFVYKNTNRIS